eukprot:137216-Pyramimonas_sp.AAC.1
MSIWTTCKNHPVDGNDSVPWQGRRVFTVRPRENHPSGGLNVQTGPEVNVPSYRVDDRRAAQIPLWTQ